MSRHNSRDLERFKECNRCGSKDTVELLSNDDENIYRFTYFGWCKTCEDTYNYDIRVDTIHDKMDRI